MPLQFVHIHSIALNTSDAVVDYCDTIINDVERRRANRFVCANMGKRWLVARAGLRQILSTYFAAAPGELEFSEGQFGKPRSSDRYASEATHFNLSHSGELAVVAVTTVAPVGVDIELMRRIEDWQQIASRFFTSRENEQLAKISHDAQIQAFYCCWTRKEAVIKATGEGLAADLKSFDVSINRNQPAVFSNNDNMAENADKWFLHHLEFGPQYVGAVALKSTSRIEVQNHGNVRWQNA